MHNSISNGAVAATTLGSIKRRSNSEAQTNTDSVPVSHPDNSPAYETRPVSLVDKENIIDLLVSIGLVFERFLNEQVLQEAIISELTDDTVRHLIRISQTFTAQSLHSKTYDGLVDSAKDAYCTMSNIMTTLPEDSINLMWEQGVNDLYFTEALLISARSWFANMETGHMPPEKREEAETIKAAFQQNGMYTSDQWWAFAEHVTAFLEWWVEIRSTRRRFSPFQGVRAT